MEDAPSLDEIVQSLRSGKGTHAIDPMQAERVLLEIQSQCHSDTEYHFSSGLLPKQLLSSLQNYLR